MIIVLNGPPGSGKDSIAQTYKEKFSERPVEIIAFKDQLYKDAFEYVKPTMDWHAFKLFCSHRVLKDQPHPLFLGLSPRGLLIHVSEKILKPMHGADYFGKAAASAVKSISLDKDIIITDGGFEREIVALRGSQDRPVFVVQVHREGCDFSQDSRLYLDTHLPFLHNNDTLDQAAARLKKILSSKQVLSWDSMSSNTAYVNADMSQSKAKFVDEVGKMKTVLGIK